jgi:hypothetical protein
MLLPRLLDCHTYHHPRTFNHPGYCHNMLLLCVTLLLLLPMLQAASCGIP